MSLKKRTEASLAASPTPSGYPGVDFKRDKNKWRATIKYFGQRIHVGYYSTKEEAIVARRNAEIAYFGDNL